MKRFWPHQASVFGLLLLFGCMCTVVSGDLRAFAATAQSAAGAPGVYAAVVLESDFWDIVDAGTKEGPSTWRFPGKGIRQESNIYGGDGVRPDPLRPGTYAVYRGKIPDDVSVRLKMLSVDNDSLGVMFRYRDSENYYRFFWDRQRSLRRLDRVVNGVVSVLAQDEEPYEKGRVYELTIDAEGETLRVHVDGRPVFSAADDAIRQGSFALYCWGNAGTSFFDIEQAALQRADPQDETAPVVGVLEPTQGPVFETTAALLSLSGTASDDRGLREIRWRNAAGGAGIADGTDAWQIPVVPLAMGENRLHIIAVDEAGNEGASEILVVRKTEESTAADKASVSEQAAQKIYAENHAREVQPRPASPSVRTAAGGAAAVPSAGEDGAMADAAVDGPGAAAGVVSEDYRIGAGDILEISLWKDESLTRAVTVLPDGTITFPLIGEIAVAGKTVGQIHGEIESRIAAYVPDPVLHVSVQQVNSMVVYVIGRVNRPGQFPVNRSVNVLQVLSMAGGLNPFAKKEQIRIYRRNGEKTETFEFDYEAVAEGEHLEQNIPLKRGDVVVVP